MGPIPKRLDLGLGVGGKKGGKYPKIEITQALESSGIESDDYFTLEEFRAVLDDLRIRSSGDKIKEEDADNVEVHKPLDVLSFLFQKYDEHGTGMIEYSVTPSIFDEMHLAFPDEIVLDVSKKIGRPKDGLLVAKISRAGL